MRDARKITSLQGGYKIWGLEGAPTKFVDRKQFSCPKATKMTRKLMESGAVGKDAAVDFYLGSNRILRQLAAGIDHRSTRSLARLFASVGSSANYSPTIMVERQPFNGHLIGFVHLRLRQEKYALEGIWTMKAEGPRMVYVCRRDEVSGLAPYDFYAGHGDGLARSLECAEDYFGTFQYGQIG